VTCIQGYDLRGYIVKNANLDLGLLTATKEVDVENKVEAFIATLFLGYRARWKKNSIIEATANVSEYGPQCRVRLNFQIKVMVITPPAYPPTAVSVSGSGNSPFSERG